MEQLERKIDGLAGSVAEIKTSVAVLSKAMERIERDISDAQKERAAIAKEVGAYGIQLTKFVQAVANLETAVGAIRPVVEDLSAAETEREGALKAARISAKIVMAAWGVLSGIGGAIIAIASLVATGRLP